MIVLYLIFLSNLHIFCQLSTYVHLATQTHITQKHLNSVYTFGQKHNTPRSVYILFTCLEQCWFFLADQSERQKFLGSNMESADWRQACLYNAAFCREAVFKAHKNDNLIHKPSWECAVESWYCEQGLQKGSGSFFDYFESSCWAGEVLVAWIKCVVSCLLWIRKALQWHLFDYET